MNKQLASALIFASTGLAAAAAALEGRVFLDANKNGQADVGEAGVARVLVSDGQRVAVTDAEGCYRLEPREFPAWVWVSVPRDHQASGAFWRRAGGRAREDFGLVRQPQPEDFAFIQITDTHIGRADALRQFARQIAAYPVACAFVVNTGDLVRDADSVFPDRAQAQYDSYLGAAAAFSVPLFTVPGNHEHVSVNAAGADQKHPLYGKGLYRRVFGPTYYSWDWAGFHCVALDGTRVPYQVALGAEQLAWLAADLQTQPREKPLLLFCHQALFSLADSRELEALLRERKVLGAFCGHMHRTFTAEWSGFSVYMSGAMSGTWWNGPNIDGSPQGFRLVSIKRGALKTVFAGREGACPVSIVAPAATALRSGVIEVEAVVVDFGLNAEVSADFDGHPVQLRQSSREELWSVWQGSVDTRLAADGCRALKIRARSGAETSRGEISYLVVNGREEPFAAEAPAMLRLQIRENDVACTNRVLLNGVPLAVIPAGTPKGTTLTFEVSKERLKRLNRVTVCVSPQAEGAAPFSFGSVSLEYKGRRIHDQRYFSGDLFSLGGGASRRFEKDLYFGLP